MKQWESKFLLRSTAATGAVIIEEANPGTAARMQVSGGVLTKGAIIMAVETGTAANPAPVQALREADESGSTDLLPARFFRVK